MDPSNKNYNEAVIVPFLEKRCKEVMSVALVLEAQLLAEREKVKDMQEYIGTLHVKLEGLRKTKKNGKSDEAPLEGDTY